MDVFVQWSTNAKWKDANIARAPWKVNTKWLSKKTRRLQTCSLWGSSPCSGSRSRAQSPQLGSPWAPPSSATPTLSHLATPEVAILLDADTINNNNAQMMRLLLERIRALSPGLVWRWLGGAGRQAGAGRGGRRGSPVVCPSTFAVGHRSLSLPPNHPPTTHSYKRPRTSHFFLIGLIFFFFYGIESYNVMNEFGYRLTTFHPNLLWLSSSLGATPMARQPVLGRHSLAFCVHS